MTLRLMIFPITNSIKKTLLTSKLLQHGLHLISENNKRKHAKIDGVKHTLNSMKKRFHYQLYQI